MAKAFDSSRVRYSKKDRTLYKGLVKSAQEATAAAAPSTPGLKRGYRALKNGQGSYKRIVLSDGTIVHRHRDTAGKLIADRKVGQVEGVAKDYGTTKTVTGPGDAPLVKVVKRRKRRKRSPNFNDSGTTVEE